MIKIKKIILFIITTSLTLLVLSTLILFFYATFFFEQTNVKFSTEENKIYSTDEKTDPQSEEKLVEETLESDASEEEENIETSQVEEAIEIPKVEEVIKDSIFATVGNKAVTHSDIIDEIKIILILNNQSFNLEMKEQLQTSAIQSIIKRYIKKIEIERFKALAFNQNDLDNELTKLANNLSMDLDTFKNTFVANGIDFLNVVDQIKTELQWNSLIFELYKDRLTINLNEIEEQLKLIKKKLMNT